LAFIQRAQPRAFNGGDVHKHVLAATAGRLDESIALRRIESLHSAFSHFAKLQESLWLWHRVTIVIMNSGQTPLMVMPATAASVLRPQ
jgi:hypothetical protein